MNEMRMRHSIRHLIGYIDEEKLERWFVDMKKFHGFSEHEIISLKVRLQVMNEQEAFDALDRLHAEREGSQ